jgi:hypothetical protein
MARLFLAAAVACALSTTISAQQAQEQTRKGGTVHKLREWADKQEDRVERIAKRFDSVGITPEVGTLGQGSGLAAGATFRKNRVAGSPLDLETGVGFSYRGYERYDFRLGLLTDRKGRTTLRPADDHIASHFDAYKERVPGFGMYVDVRYRHSPLHRFFGMGPVTRDEDRTSFLLRGASYDLVTEYQATRWLGFAVRGGILDFEVGPGGDTKRPSTELVFDDGAAPGLRRQPAYFHAGLATAIDGRDSAEAPRSGGMIGLMAWRFDSIDTARDDFSRLAMDARYYVPASGRSVLAFRALASRDFADSGGRVPFYMEQTLGGGDTLRGFERARFRDAALMNVSAEYRFDVHPMVELAGFGDVGQVAPRLSNLAARRFQTSWGAGLRFKHRGSVKFRADWAISREGQRLILSTGPVF